MSKETSSKASVYSIQVYREIPKRHLAAKHRDFICSGIAQHFPKDRFLYHEFYAVVR